MKINFVLVLLVCYFQTLQGEESFVLIDGSTSQIIQQYGPNLETQATPACSFNIALSLMGYDAGVLFDETSPVWDFQEGYDDANQLWRASQTPKTWMGFSCVWFSKLLACELGLDTIQRYLDLFEYGNRDLSGGIVGPGSTNPAWISSSLKISPLEQVNFIQKMRLGLLSASDHAVEKTKGLLFKEELSKGRKLYGKTGLGTIFCEDGNKLKVMWFVGWIEEGLAFFPFVFQIQAETIDPTQTVPRVKQLLEESLSKVSSISSS